MAKSRIKVDPGIVRNALLALDELRQAVLRAGDLAATPVLEVPPSEQLTLRYIERLEVRLRERWPGVQLG